MTIDISDNSPRVSYTANSNGAQTAFAVPFEFFDNADLNVYVANVLKTIGTGSANYGVSGGAGSTGTVTFVSGVTASAIVVITRSISIERTTDFTAGSDINRAALNTQLDILTAISADLKDTAARALQLTDSDAAASLVLPAVASRKGKALIFNSSSGNVEAAFQVTAAAVNVSGVSVGGSATGSVSVSGGTATFALGIPAGATGATGATGQAGGGLANVSSDTTPELGGDLDVLAKDIVSSGNRTIDLAPHGTGTVVVRGNTNSGAIIFNCDSNSHGQKVIAQPHSATVTNVLTLPAGGDATLVSTAGAAFTGAVTVSSAAVKVAGKESIWIPAAAMYPSTTNPCSDLTQVETTALRPDLKVLDFAAAADDFAQFSVAFPKSWNLGTISYQPFWTVTGTNAGTVVWQLGGVAITSDETLNTAFGTLVATTALAHSTTSNDLMVSAESGAVTVAGSPADNDQCFFQINLDTSASGQTGVVRLLGVKLFFTTDAANDA